MQHGVNAGPIRCQSVGEYDIYDVSVAGEE